MFDDEPYMDESFEIESALGSAGMGTDEYYRPAMDVDELAPKHCNAVDPELFSAFSDCYKDDNGFRPRFFIAREQVVEWFAMRKLNPPDWMTEDK